MNKKYLLAISCFTFVFLFFNSTSATVGGPIFLSDFRYDKEGGDIYFIENYSWWSKIIKYEVSSLEKEEIAHYGSIMAMFPETERQDIAEKYGCPNDEQLESCVESKRKALFEAEKQRILEFDSLSRIDLTENGIKIDVSVIDQGEEGQHNWWGFTEVDFIAGIDQDDLRKGEIQFHGYYRKDVSTDVAINFDAFRIPSTNTTLFLFGRRGQADETGYLLEEVFFVDGIEIIHPDPLPLRLQEKCLVGHRSHECEDFPGDWFWRKGAFPAKGGLFVSFSFDEELDLPFTKAAVAQDYSEPTIGEDFSEEGEFPELPDGEQSVGEPEDREDKAGTSLQKGQGGAILPLLVAGAALIVGVLFLYFKKRKPGKDRNVSGDSL